MKKYQQLNETERKQAQKHQQDALLLFQQSLRGNPLLMKQYHGKALEIADGIQPWIDALEISINS